MAVCCGLKGQGSRLGDIQSISKYYFLPYFPPFVLTVIRKNGRGALYWVRNRGGGGVGGGGGVWCVCVCEVGRAHR